MTILLTLLLAWAAAYAGAVLAVELHHAHQAGKSRLNRYDRRTP